MEAIEQITLVNERQRNKRRSVSTAELYAVLEALLPFARIDIECLASFGEDFPDDPDHAEDAERVRVGMVTLESAKHLIARKTSYYRRREQALREKPCPTGSPPEASDGW